MLLRTTQDRGELRRLVRWHYDEVSGLGWALALLRRRSRKYLKPLRWSNLTRCWLNHKLASRLKSNVLQLTMALDKRLAGLHLHLGALVSWSDDVVGLGAWKLERTAAVMGSSNLMNCIACARA